MLVSCLGIPAQLNALLDFHAPEMIPVKIVDKHISKSSRGPDFYVLISKSSRGPDFYVLTVMPEEGKNEELHTAQEIYEDTEIGDSGYMAVFRGALSMPYAEFVPENEFGITKAG